MTTEHYTHLLKKYKSEHCGETWSKESEKNKVQNWRLSSKIKTAEIMMDRLNIIGTQRDEVNYLVTNIPFKQLHRQVSDEVIILAICMYIKKVRQDIRRCPEEYAVCKEYGLTTKLSYIIVCRILEYVMAQQPLKCKPDTF